MFEDRKQAGLLLAAKLLWERGNNFVVLAVPRGGVVVAKEVARVLKAPLGLVVVKKIGLPGQEELAIGAVAPDGFIALDSKTIKDFGVTPYFLKKAEKEAFKELARREKTFRVKRESLRGKDAILVDDGIATGSTVEVAILYIRSKKPKKIILAVPVAPYEVISRLKRLVEKVVVIETPLSFSSVGQFYEDFPQVTDEEVIKLLQ